ncbi:MAG: autorepressor SdpR family transcription factor [Clostridiales bacterium]|nr:autorepressor SdpR family transcription factor [Clostridiales bacterium]
MKNEWSAMSDKTRREILTMLKTRPHTAGEIADQFELSAATVSHHLSVLKASGLVTSEKRAQTIIYSMNASVLKKMLRVVGSFLD